MKSSYSFALPYRGLFYSYWSMKPQVKIQHRLQLAWPDVSDEVKSINQLQLDFEDYVSTTVVDNLEDIQGQLDETSESAEANS